MAYAKYSSRESIVDLGHFRARWLVVAAFLTCSCGTAPSPDSNNSSEVTQSNQSSNDSVVAVSRNLSNEEALRLLEQSNGLVYQTEAMAPFGGTMADAERFISERGLVNTRIPQCCLIYAPVFSEDISIDGISTEGNRANIRYTVRTEAIQPNYDFYCVENRDIVRGATFASGATCRHGSISGTKTATREDDGRWIIAN